MYSIEDKLTFGKHQGRTISEIITGLEGGADGELSVMFYLRELFDFLSNDKYEFDVRGSNYFIEFLGEIYGQENYDTPYYVIFKSCNSLYENKYIEKEFIILRLTDDERINLNNSICEFLLAPFKDNIILRHTKEKQEKLSPNSLKIRPEPSYINWAINNLPNFIIDPNDLENEFRCRKLTGFNIIPIDLNKSEKIIHISDNPGGWYSKESIIDYTPIIKEYSYSFPDHIKKMNLDKYMNYQSSEEANTSDFENYGKSFNQYGGPSINGNRLSDDVINDAFEGDPLNYWNID